MEDLFRKIRDVPDFPQEGIVFKDITPLLADGAALVKAIECMAEPFKTAGIEAVVGIESRGFIFGVGIALQLGCGFVPVRKPGKLPAATLQKAYALEYGTDAVEIHADAVAANQRVLVVDDVLATGGTMLATCELLAEIGADIAGISFLMELSFLQGRERLDSSIETQALLTY